MKRILVTMVVVLLAAGVAMADNRPISLDKLPHKAQTFLKQHFADSKVSLVTQDDDLVAKDYEVVLESGTRIDFSPSGDWQEVEVRQGVVPVSLVPTAIASYVNRHYAAERVVRLERDRRTWEVKLSNGLELTFDKQYRLIDIDD